MHVTAQAPVCASSPALLLLLHSPTLSVRAKLQHSLGPAAVLAHRCQLTWGSGRGPNTLASHHNLPRSCHPRCRAQACAWGFLGGGGAANVSLRASSPTASRLIVCWAQELMTRMFIVNIPLIFGAMWRVASMIIDDRVKAKIRFLKKSEMGQLYEFIDRDQLPTSLGGTREGCLSTHTGGLCNKPPLRSY